jgi:5-carboxymethyl-2-hydroxymuconate isomerase
MPHIELKTTPNLDRTLDVPGLLRELVEKMSSFETVNSVAVKAYHVPVASWAMGAGAPKGFAHCTVRVLSGRPVELRKKMAVEMVAVMRHALANEIAAGEASVTLELREMDSETYQK